jgi:dipeptidyl aminopeptidase/acylaminoacyl peptidase
MLKLPVFQRCFFGLSLVIAIFAGWFLHGIPAAHTTSSAHSTASNIPLNAMTKPISSSLVTPLATRLPAPRENVVIRSSLYQLTSGLRPGRGSPIPAASSVQQLPVVDVSFYNWRGELLSGWLALQTPEAPIVILTHGTPGNRVDMVSRAAFLYQHGYNVLLFDFQSYGKSQGVMSTLGMVESEDILAAISYIHGLPATEYSKVGVLGLSMGATAAVLAASRSSDVVALVAESCPVDATLVTSDVPDDATREADREVVEQVYGVDITQARPIAVVNKLANHTAIFFINGDADDTTPLSGMEALYAAAGQPKQSWVVAGAGHAQSFATDSADYESRVDAFFDTYLHA